MKRSTSRRKQSHSRRLNKPAPDSSLHVQPQRTGIIGLQEVIGHKAVRSMVETEHHKTLTAEQAQFPVVKTPIAKPTNHQPAQAPMLLHREVSDTIPETKNQFYAHGGFMGAAPELMADPKWSKILQVLMPDVWEGMSDTSTQHKWIAMMENNPVMAAYGAFKTKLMDDANEGNRSDRIATMKAFEWDAFLPDELVSLFKKTQDPDERTTIAADIVDNIVIAHGTTKQTILENTLDSREYDNVRATKKSNLGGTLPGAWMDLFGKALQLAGDPDWEKKLDKLADRDENPRYEDKDDQALYQTFRKDVQMPFNEVIALYKEMFKKDTFSVLLDVKSRDATPDVLKAIVLELNRRGVHVYGVGSFQFGELEGLEQLTQTVDGQEFAGPTEVRFFHRAGDLQNACLNNSIRAGDTVMFNAGSLISYDRYSRGENKKDSYQLRTEVINQLRIYKNHYGFRLGVYVQEFDIDDRAATMLMEVTNNNPDLFDLGFGWGGLSGKTASEIEPALTDATVGESMQHFAGKEWDTSKPQPADPEPVGDGFTSTISLERVLRSRNFEVKNGKVTVTCDASWNPELPFTSTYFISLHEDKTMWWDSDEGKMGYPLAKTHSATWSGLDSGTYYLMIRPDRTAESSTYKLQGSITVST